MANRAQRPLALISVTDKSGLIDFVKSLVSLNFEILSTGGTAKHLTDMGIKVTDVSSYTESPEVLDGRVKTLHPAVHGGILADRSLSSHLEQLPLINARVIDLVVVNLYDFKKDAKEKGLPLEKAINHIDIGGPTMLRAAAKNYVHCLPVIDPVDYDDVLRELKTESQSLDFRKKMAFKVFQTINQYDALIADFFRDAIGNASQNKDAKEHLPETLTLTLDRRNTLRYGENSHQEAAIYENSSSTGGIPSATILQGKELSYNNYLDLDAAIDVISDLTPTPAMTIIKHTNPCGTAASSQLTAKDIFLKALGADPKSAFGGIVASNIPIDEAAALAMTEIFLECIIAPEFSTEAVNIFSNKKNLRLLKYGSQTKAERIRDQLQFRSICGGYLVQTPDNAEQDFTTWQTVSKVKPNEQILRELAFAMSICKNVKSNAIVLSADHRSIGIGSGQMSRIDSLKIAINKASELGHQLKGAVLASDAFFPFRDCVDEAAKVGITAIVQPGGSLRDQESIDAADEHGLIMVMTGRRHFKH
jgi:phosphoribosylaminoimidazolecarboxamide formyltransferase / IMP cyclohydrolase